jgi:hypothetical protein
LWFRIIARTDGPEKAVDGLAPKAQGMETERMYKIHGNRIAEFAFRVHPGERFTASISL